MNNGLEKKYDLLTAIALVVGIVIGSGVFFKAQTILTKTNGNMPLGILAWIVGGCIMLSCILAFAVMATKYEKVNGIVDYAEAAVGGKYGYAIGWFMTFIYYPAITSVLAWLSARFTLVFITSAWPEFPMMIPAAEGGCVVGPECMALSVFFMCAAYFINAISPKIAGYFQVTTTIIKLIPLILMAIVGIICGLVSENGVLIENMTTTGIDMAETATSNPLFASIVATSFAYEGWIIATSINSELKDSKKNLPIALVAGGIIIAVIYIAYYVGVAGGASVEQLINDGATVAYINVFGKVFGTVLNLFVAISCMGTLNGLMLGCTRGIYSIAARGEGPKARLFAQVDAESNMANNSAILGLMMCSIWFLFFYLANLGTVNYLGFFGFDSSELPIVTLYALYIPVFIGFMKKATEFGKVRRFVFPVLGICGSIFMVIAAIYAHGIQPAQASVAAGTAFRCPVLGYLIIFVVVMIIGLALYKNKKTSE